ncbi:hypothetical protein HOD20_08670 [archaeon]|jgi:hypothetical protein|nr:hypothetical protein [archaeon]MBT4352582.1 hypothetical protein [archaeon]MBT4647793.1 hypothetical protein [archaeon]MBT6821654.1 hypothetical protein [archaeon]MBT7391818.1 hypothetical protein [archaeon]
MKKLIISLFILIMSTTLVYGSQCFYEETNGNPENYCFVDESGENLKISNLLENKNFECFYKAEGLDNACETKYSCTPGAKKRVHSENTIQYITTVCIEERENFCKIIKEDVKIDGSGYKHITNNIEIYDEFDIEKSYCKGMQNGKIVSIKPNIAGFKNKYYCILTGLDADEEVKAYINKNGEEIECLPTLNEKKTITGSIKYDFEKGLCDYVYGGRVNIYENPKYCREKKGSNGETIKECEWMEENNCKSGEIGCITPPIDNIPRQDLCKVYACSFGEFKVINQKYDGAKYYEVCIDKKEKLPEVKQPVKQIDNTNKNRRIPSTPRKTLKDVIEESNMNSALKWMLIDLIKDLEGIGRFIEKNF